MKQSTSPAIKAVIFDCFGVLYVGSLSELANHCQTPQEQQAFYDLSHASDHGFITRQAFIEGAIPLVHLSKEEIGELVAAQQVRNRGVFAYARELKRRGYIVAVFSNIGRESIGKLFTAEEQETVFDAIIASGDIGATKPHVSAYERMLTEIGVQPSEAIMIDDALSNVDGANETGMHGVIFTTILQCRRQVEELLLDA